jgi:murein L,D-transpeptidase YcbB/YkuD
MRGCRAVWIIALLLLPVGCSRDNDVHKTAIRSTVGETPSWVERTALGQRLWALERQFYERRGYLPAWIDGDRTTPQLKVLIEQFRYSEVHGLDPAAYPGHEYERIREESQTFLGTRFEAVQVPELDARLTYGYLRYAADLLGWNDKPSDIANRWLTQPKDEDLATRLADAIQGNRIRESLEELAPTHQQYKGLAAALARERQHPTGQAERIRLNMERWRWMPRDLGQRYVLINVPGYSLQVMQESEPVLAMRVIVGKHDTPTPLFSDEMTYIVFSPYWNIPENILRDETLPRAAKDPDFLERSNIEVVGTSGAVDPASIDWADESVTSTIRLRQRPGPDNALGLVKFIFPNNFSIYLHDTPSDRLFFRDKRAFSHGCIRIEDPIRMAEYVLRDQPAWTVDRITSAMHAGREQHVKLMHPLPVHIGYWTAWVQPDGSVTFTDDPYGLDDSHLESVRQTPQAQPTPVRPTQKTS